MCMAPKMIGNERMGDFIFMTWQEFEQQFSIQLNEQQKSAVQSVDGPVLLLAVPGSGKTTVLVTRLGYMIYCKGMNPGKILTVTYTVAATKDMADRFAVKFGQEMAERLEFRTINGICARVIQYYSWKTGRMAFQLLTDEKRITAMLSGIYQQTERVYPTEGDLKNVRTLITYIKNRMLNEKEIQKLEEKAEIHLAAIYKEYCRQLREQQLMDYDDQMVYAYNNFLHIFRRNTLIFAWMKPRIHRKSSMPSLHCWHRNPKIFLWWEMKIRAFMDSVPLTRRHCWNLSIIIRERKCCSWKKISVPMETLF